MLRFFRQIRQRLLTDNKFGKYLLYAVGEILLVVIGILIALKVDNWNTEKENDLKEQKVLSALHQEFLENKNQLTRVKSFHLKVLNASTGLLDMITNYPNKYSKSHVDSLLKAYGYYLTFDPKSSALEASISSGDIHLIKNDSLTNLLFTYPAIVSDAAEEEIQAKEVLFKQKDFLSRYVREMDVWSENRKSAFNSDYIGLLKNPDFENMVFTREGIVRELVKEQNNILRVNSTILSLIENEIK